MLVQFLQKQIESGDVNFSQALRDADYSPSTVKQGTRIIKSQSFQKLLLLFDEEPLLQELYDISLKHGDSRAQLTAIQMLFRLKNRFPDPKIKITAVDERDEVIDDD